QLHCSGARAKIAVVLETPVDTLGFLECGYHRLVADLQLPGNSDRSQGVAHVVHPGQAKTNIQRLLDAFAYHAKACFTRGEAHIPSRDIRVRIHTVGQYRTSYVAEDVAHARIV